ncbi:MAG: tetratricopeptide repeat protein [Bacteroidetes bacterium]|nr:tetratricopeptide repeat protein [Bacteroidota bacterium]
MKHNLQLRIKNLSKYFLVIICTQADLHLCTFLPAQNGKIDSLLAQLKRDKEDTNKVNHLDYLASALYSTNPDSTILLGTQAVAIAKKINFKKGEANSYSSSGVGYWAKADYLKALENYFNALKIDETLKDSSGLARIFGNIGIVYDEQSDYPKALEYYGKALKIAEQRGDKKRIAIQLSNMGVVYDEESDYANALDYDFKTLKLTEELGAKNLIASALGNIGIVYDHQAESSSKNKNVNEDLLNKAMNYYLQALKLDEELGNQNNSAAWLGNIGTLSITLKKYKQAEKYLLDALAIDTTIGFLNHTQNTEEQLSDAYEKMGKPELALKYYKNAMALKDTLFSQEKNKEITRKELNYQFEKKQNEQKAAQEKKDALAQADARKQKVILLFVIGGLGLVILFAGFIFRSLRVTRKQKKIIEIKSAETEKQKILIEEKNKDILDSIHYAKRIQQSLLPTEKYIGKNLSR